MARTARTNQIFTIREVGTNRFLGTYSALTADQAIRKFAVTASVEKPQD